MYPSRVTDIESLEACFDRMYKDYVRFCKSNGATNEMILSKEDFMGGLRLMNKELLARAVHSFNSRELAVAYN